MLRREDESFDGSHIQQWFSLSWKMVTVKKESTMIYFNCTFSKQQPGERIKKNRCLECSVIAVSGCKYLNQ